MVVGYPPTLRRATGQISAGFAGAAGFVMAAGVVVCVAAGVVVWALARLGGRGGRRLDASARRFAVTLRDTSGETRQARDGPKSKFGGLFACKKIRGTILDLEIGVTFRFGE